MAFLFLAKEGRETHGITEVGRRVERGWHTMSCSGVVGDTRNYRGRPACREGLALLFLAEEGRETHRIKSRRPASVQSRAGLTIFCRGGACRAEGG